MLAGRGHEVIVPTLAGHGGSLEELAATGWGDWVATAEAAGDRASWTGGPVVAVGVSMGGTLACHLAATRPGIAGLAVVNPFVDPPAPSFRQILEDMLDQGVTALPAIGGDVADPAAVCEGALEGLPVACVLSLCHGLDDLAARLGAITCPTLVLTSRTDHVVPPVSSDVLAAAVAGPVERVWLERSFHVATLDHDAGVVEERIAAFVDGVAGRLPSA